MEYIYSLDLAILIDSFSDSQSHRSQILNLITQHRSRRMHLFSHPQPVNILPDRLSAAVPLSSPAICEEVRFVEDLDSGILRFVHRTLFWGAIWLWLLHNGTNSLHCAQAYYRSFYSGPMQLQHPSSICNCDTRPLTPVMFL